MRPFVIHSTDSYGMATYLVAGLSHASRLRGSVASPLSYGVLTLVHGSLCCPLPP